MDDGATKAVLRPARVTDVPQMAQLINKYASRNLMLPRPVNQVYERLKDYCIVEADGVVAGCSALQILWYDLAEVRSVAVHEGFRGRGFGRLMVERLLGEAKTLGIHQVIMLVLPDGPMHAIARSLGFREVEKESLPQKVWNDCLNCPKFSECDEIALITEAAPKTESPHDWHSIMKDNLAGKRLAFPTGPAGRARRKPGDDSATTPASIELATPRPPDAT